MEKTLYSEKSAEFHVATCIDGSAAPEKAELLRTKSREACKGARQVIHVTVFVP